ncbi:Rrf2 family transcriptional regulator, partial [Nocardiopsis tropica]|nr:Rrf2 family transcriptional regulator [Nocardiopsis tropica]
AKAVARLSGLGIVETRRGRNSGLRLTEEGRRTPVGSIERALEGGGDLAGCEDDPPCPLRAACRLRGALRDAREAFYSSLDAVTVEALVAPPTRDALSLLRPEQAAGPSA